MSRDDSEGINKKIKQKSSRLSTTLGCLPFGSRFLLMLLTFSSAPSGHSEEFFCDEIKASVRHCEISIVKNFFCDFKRIGKIWEKENFPPRARQLEGNLRRGERWVESKYLKLQNFITEMFIDVWRMWVTWPDKISRSRLADISEPVYFRSHRLSTINRLLD